MKQYGTDSIKELVDFVNDRQIPRDNIVSILPQDSGTFTLLYFDAD